MEVYQSKYYRAVGSNYKEVHKEILPHYQKIKRATKRQPYLRARVFGNQKVFLSFFWTHLNQKNWRDRSRRLAFFEPGIDLIRNNVLPPLSKEGIRKPHLIYHRFFGLTRCGKYFVIQIKEDRRVDKKFLMSIFPFDIKEKKSHRHV